MQITPFRTTYLRNVTTTPHWFLYSFLSYGTIEINHLIINESPLKIEGSG